MVKNRVEIEQPNMNIDKKKMKYKRACPLCFVLFDALRSSTQCEHTHIIWFGVHLIKFYMIISSHFDDHQQRFGVLVTHGLLCNRFEYSMKSFFCSLLFFPSLFFSYISNVSVLFIVVLIAFLLVVCITSKRYLLHSFMNLEHFPL